MSLKICIGNNENKKNVFEYLKTGNKVNARYIYIKKIVKLQMKAKYFLKLDWLLVMH